MVSYNINSFVQENAICMSLQEKKKKKTVNSESNKVVKNHGIIALQRHLRAIWFSLFILKMRKLSHHDMSSISYLGGNMEQNSSFLM